MAVRVEAGGRHSHGTLKRGRWGGIVIMKRISSRREGQRREGGEQCVGLVLRGASVG
jgi:hypothetical protein